MMEELRRFYGLDVSVAVQLGRYLWRLLQLDLGFSAIYGKPVSAVILERLPDDAAADGIGPELRLRGRNGARACSRRARSIAGPIR